MHKPASPYVMHPALPARLERHRQPGLGLSDYAFLICLGLALLIVAAPEELELERQATKHVPILFGLMSLALIMLGQALFPKPRAENWSLRPLMPLILLATLIILGGSWARFALDTQNSFLVAGIYCLAAPLAACILIRSPNPEHLLRAYFCLLILASVAVCVILAMNYGVRQVYHELEFIFPPLAVLVAASSRSRMMKVVGIGYFLLIALLYKKNTGYLIGLLVVGYLALFYLWPVWKRQADGLRRGALVYAVGLSVIVCAVLIAYVVLNREQYLPTGNPAFRLVTYERAWLRFLDSPLWGNLFTGPAAEFFPAFDTGVSNNILPTHSDLLDILAHGGLLGAALWVWAMLRISRLVLSALHQSAKSDLLPYLHALACMSIAAIITYAFNPIILQPGKALLMWSHLGLMVGVAISIANKPRSPK